MDSEYDRYIVVSFVDVTLVLSIGDTVEEASHGACERHACRDVACRVMVGSTKTQMRLYKDSSASRKSLSM